MMLRDMIRMPVSAVLCLGLLAGFVTVAGCSSSATTDDKRDDPALKASMQKSMEIYKAKTQAKKQRHPAAAKSRL